MSAAGPEQFLEAAGRLADASGAIVRRYFRTAFSVDSKADATPVTVADRNAEAAMRAIIRAEFPDHGIIGEEYGSTNPDAEYVWILDPIDGTKAFITGMPVFGTLVALLRNGRPILGIIDQPVLRERWVGAEGRPTCLNGKPVRTREKAEFASACLYATHPDMFRGENRGRFEALTAQVGLMRFGGDCYAYGLLAAGHIDLVVEARLALYDFAALAPVVSGAGGAMTDWNGKPLDRFSDGRVIAAANAACHEGALAILRD